jgi:hypothetical protein
MHHDPDAERQTIFRHGARGGRCSFERGRGRSTRRVHVEMAVLFAPGDVSRE